MKVRIKDIADIRSGHQFREKIDTDEDADTSVIQIKDIDQAGRLNTDNLDRVNVTKPDVHSVSMGDVLFLSRGARPFAIFVNERLRNTIATSYFFILRPDPNKTRPDFLAWSINQPEFQDSLRSRIRGTHMRIISKSDFQDLEIELPPLSVQESVMRLQRLLDEELELANAIQEKRRKMVQAIARKLITGQLSDQEFRHE